MDLIGHCVTAELSGVIPADVIEGPRLLELMFLNYMHCHDWAYANCWQPAVYGSAAPVVAAIRAHMICDWVIHFGDSPAPVKMKRGWAYRRMMLAGRRRGQFFHEALERGLLRDLRRIDPEVWSRKERFDFDHSMVEYALDIKLAARHVTASRFRAMKEAIGRLGTGTRYGSWSWARDLAQRLGATSDRDTDYIRAAVEGFGADGLESESADEFAVRTAIRKYGLSLSPAAIVYVRGFLTEIAAQIDDGEIDALCAAITAQIRQGQPAEGSA